MTPDQKWDAWQESFERAMDREQRVGCPSAVRAEWASKHADEALALTEQREREGRFGPAETEDHDPVATEAARRMEAKRADRAEAEVESLRVELGRTRADAGEVAGAHHREEERLRDDRNTANPARASEAALFERVATLEKALPELRERTARLVETRCSNPITGAVLAGLIRGRDDDLNGAYLAALRPLSKPETP